MKITKKYLRKLIKEEVNKIIEQYNRDDDPAVKQIKTAIKAGLKDEAGISLIKPIKIINIRRYRGSGTGYTIEIETDQGSIKWGSQ